MTTYPNAPFKKPGQALFLRRFYDWVMEQAKHKHAQWVLFAVAFAESSFLMLPPDVILMAMVLAHRQKWIRYFLICTAGSVAGAVLGYAIGAVVWDAVGPWFIGHIFSQSAFDKVVGLYQEHDFWCVFTAAFTPIPYKVFTIAGGVAHIDLGRFLLASVIGRGARFILVAFLLHRFGPPIRVFIEKYLGLLTLLFTLLLIGGIWFLKHAAH